MTSKVYQIISFLNNLRLEPFLFIFVFVMMLRRVPQDQILQDKICIQKYNLPHDFCYKLPTFNETTDPRYHYKSQILGDSTQFNMYLTLVATLPSVFWSLFFGSWTDKYAPAKKILLLIGGLSYTIEGVLLAFLAIKFDTGKNRKKFFLGSGYTCNKLNIYLNHFLFRLQIHYYSSTYQWTRRWSNSDLFWCLDIRCCCHTT
jgi:hypothetical protein